MQIDEVSNKIDREIQKAMKKNEKNNQFLETQYGQLQEAQMSIDH